MRHLIIIHEYLSLASHINNFYARARRELEARSRLNKLRVVYQDSCSLAFVLLNFVCPNHKINDKWLTKMKVFVE